MSMMRKIGAWLFGSAMLAAAASAHANNWYSDTLVGTPGGQVTATWTYDFGTDYPLWMATMEVSYDPALMNFLPEMSSVDVNGAPYSFAGMLAALETLDPDVSHNVAPGIVAFSFFLPLDGPASVPVSGPVTFSAVFVLAPDFSGPAYIDFSGAVAGDEEQLFSGTITVTAVPEPETWLMWLGGLGLLASRYARRRQA